MASSLECTVCLEDFNIPLVLPCGHTFCHECVQGCVQNCSVRCPLCKVLHEVPGGRADVFPKNYVLLGMTSSNEKTSRTETKIDIITKKQKTAELATHAIHQIKRNPLTLIKSFSARTPLDKHEPMLNDVTVMSDGNVVVGDIGGNHKVKVFSNTGDIISESHDGQFCQPYYLSHLNTQEVVVCEGTQGGKHQMSKWNIVTKTKTPLLIPVTNPAGVTLTNYKGHTVGAVIDYDDKVKLFSIHDYVEVGSFSIKSGCFRIAGHGIHDCVVATDSKGPTYYKAGEERWTMDLTSEDNPVVPGIVEMFSDGSVIVPNTDEDEYMLISPEGVVMDNLVLPDLPDHALDINLAYSDQLHYLVFIRAQKPEIKIYHC